MALRNVILSNVAVVAATLAFAVPTNNEGPDESDESSAASHPGGGPQSGPWIVAHRGSPRVAPEQTEPAYTSAIEEGADVLEGDVQLTADGEMVLVHDDSLARNTNVKEEFPDLDPWNVGDLTLEEIKSLDAGSWFDDRFAGEQILTVEELLELNDGEVGITLEMKAPESSPGVATELANLLEEYDLTDDDRTRTGAYEIMVHSRGQDALHEFADILPDVPLVYLTGGPMLEDEELAELSEWTMGVFADPRDTRASDIQRATDHDLEVYADPVDSPEQVRMAIDQGYTWILTNQPETALQARDKPQHDPHPNDILVDHVYENPPDDDVQPETGEHVTLRNTTAEPIDISGHYLRDQAGNIVLWMGDDSTIDAGSLFRVYVGPGTNRPDAYYNGYDTGMLNNTRGDTITYYNDDHEIVDTFSYIVPR